MKPVPVATEGQLKRFWLKVDKRGPRKSHMRSRCWIWTGATVTGGYGAVKRNGQNFLAHRVAFVDEFGEIADGLTVDHLCFTTSCVRPSHLEAVTMDENLRRGQFGKHNVDKTECPRGHPYEGENLLISGGRRICRTCKRVRELAAYHRRKDEGVIEETQEQDDDDDE